MSKKRFDRYYHPRRDPVIQFPEDFWSDPQALVTFLRTYLGLGTDVAVFLDNALTLLGDLDTRPLTAEHAGAIMMGRALLLMTPLIDTRHSQRKRAFGGKDRPLEFDPAELEQTLPEQWQLPRRLHPLCKWLLDDLWTLFRLVRAARDVYRRKRQAWVHLHRLIGLVLVRLLRVWKQLCRCYTPWIALVSLRWALREVWGTLFGSPVKLTKTARSFLKLDALSIGQEWDLWMRLKQESEAGTEVPGPFVGMVETWLKGGLPPPYREQTDEERIAEARFWL